MRRNLIQILQKEIKRQGKKSEKVLEERCKRRWAIRRAGQKKRLVKEQKGKKESRITIIQKTEHLKNYRRKRGIRKP